MEIKVSTPSRICLFGEHQDYLGLEVIALAIDLRFAAKGSLRDDGMAVIDIRDEKYDFLGVDPNSVKYQRVEIDINKPIEYVNKRDYLKSTINVLLRKGYEIGCGFDAVMDSEIPIGKGMCSSSTMIVALIKLLLELSKSPDADKPEVVAQLAFDAEVAEFKEPGGKMDHFTSALGGLNHINFDPMASDEGILISRMDAAIPGNFILFDSLEQKNTIKVLAMGKEPVVAALGELKEYGIDSIRDFFHEPEKLELLNKLDDVKKKKLSASIDNYKILKQAETMLKDNASDSSIFDMEKFGSLIYAHHKNLRDGLGISTDTIEKIMDTAIEAGALGGKVNGSGGGGCLYVYCHEEDNEAIQAAVQKLGFPGKVLKMDTGSRRDDVRAVVLAAGKGTRLQSEAFNLPKVLQMVNDKPLIDYVLENISFVHRNDTWVVAGYEADSVIEHLSDEYNFTLQNEQLGTGHAVKVCYDDFMDYNGNVLVLYGDMPLFRSKTYSDLIKAHLSGGADCTMLTVFVNDQPAYGRIIRDDKGSFVEVAEERDCTDEQKQIKELNVGIYVFKSKILFESLENIKNNNSQGEYYLTDVPAEILRKGGSISIHTTYNEDEIWGVNTPEELILCQNILKERRLKA